MPNLNPDIRIHWAGAVEVDEDRQWSERGCDERAFAPEEILKQLGSNAVSITKVTDRLMIANQQQEDGQDDELNTKLIGVLSEELETLYSDRECLYRIDAMRELLHST